jgi:hypothetical protein
MVSPNAAVAERIISSTLEKIHMTLQKVNDFVSFDDLEFWMKLLANSINFCIKQKKY